MSNPKSIFAGLGRSLTGGVLPALVCLVSVVSAHEDNSVLIRQLTEKIEASPRDAGLYLRRAEMQRLNRHWHAAESDYKKAAELDPKLALVELAYGTMWNDAARPDKALPLLDSYVRREPEKPDGYAERARAKRLLKRWNDAAADYEAAVGKSSPPDPELFAEWADNLCDAGDVAGGVAVLDRGLARLGPVSSLEIKALNLEQTNGMLEAALMRLDPMLDRPGRKDSLLLRKAEILIAAGREDQARQCVALARKEFEAVPESRRATAAGKELANRLERIEKHLEEKANKPDAKNQSP